MLVVVQTYPAHFYQTLGCLRSIHNIIPGSEILLIIDDRSTLCWTDYVRDCRDTYQGYVSDTVLTSEISGLRFLHSYPWLRQQTTKLLLDTVVDRDHWLFIDGDVTLLGLPPLDSVPAARVRYTGVPLGERDPAPGEMSSQVLYYIKHMLGTDFGGFWDDETGLMITASHPPVRVMRRDLLQDLRRHVETRLGSPLVVIHKNLAADTRMAASEWDLIECFRQSIMGEPAAWHWDLSFCETTWSGDQELGLQWFRDRGLEIDDAVWRVLPDQKYF